MGVWNSEGSFGSGDDSYNALIMNKPCLRKNQRKKFGGKKKGAIFASEFFGENLT